MAAQIEFLSGVIEGFYGQPWSQAERFQLFEWMSRWGLNTYLYAPKDDLKHRALWRELYSAEEIASLRELARATAKLNIRFIYALSPGLDIHYSDPAELDRLKARAQQMQSIGCMDFALLFDDIPDQMSTADADRFGSFASAQCHVTNALFRWSRENGANGRFLFCPTPYCGRMAERKLGGKGYLETIGRELLPGIDVFWTGPEIISREISLFHIREMQSLLRRKPLIWDNLHANDYDGRRFFVGPYSGRDSALLRETAGILSNPNTEFAFNYVPLRTLARFLQTGEAYDARLEYLNAMTDWLRHFETFRGKISLEELALLGDCYYLPYEDGPEADSLFHGLEQAINHPQPGPESNELRRRIALLRDTCARLPELRDRRLFYALSRRAWELREELDLLDKFLVFQTDPQNAGRSFTSDFHLPGTYRGGFVPRLQRLLRQQSDGTFKPAHE